MTEKRKTLFVDKEYSDSINALNLSGILVFLPRSGKQGIIGINGEEYPVPDKKQVNELVLKNKELVDKKIDQGFTKLLLTPFAIHASQLTGIIRTALIKHNSEGKIIRTKQNSADPDIPVCLKGNDPLWIWERMLKALDTPEVVYFPKTHKNPDHQGLTKIEVIKNARYCGIPGWSVGLIEPVPVMPLCGQGISAGGRKQLEGYSAPNVYLQTLSSPNYLGETGWTPEDFLTHFLIQLETTNQISHDRHDNNALWLLGSYMPESMPNAKLVPVGFWDSNAGPKLRLSAHRTSNKLRSWVARSIVRLGITCEIDSLCIQHTR